MTIPSHTAAIDEFREIRATLREHLPPATYARMTAQAQVFIKGEMKATGEDAITVGARLSLFAHMHGGAQSINVVMAAALDLHDEHEASGNPALENGVCPYCSTKLSAAMAAGEIDGKPSLALCHECGELLSFDDDLKPIPAPESLLAEIAGSPELTSAIQARLAGQKYKKLEAESK